MSAGEVDQFLDRALNPARELHQGRELSGSLRGAAHRSPAARLRNSSCGSDRARDRVCRLHSRSRRFRIASSSAENRGAILPDARTWQADAGLRYSLTPQVKLIAGVFEIDKPYFNIDTSNVDRELGWQRADGFEFSASGAVTKNLNVTAAMLLGEVKTIGPNLQAEGVGPFALNQARFLTTINANYKFRERPALSADVAITHFGSYPASIDDVAQGPAATMVSLGGRYRFEILGAPATLRVQVQNLTNVYFWNLAFNSPVFTQYQPRAVFAYLTTDF